MRELIEVGDADQGIAADQVMVEEAERPAFLEAFEPEREAGQLQGHRVAVDAVDAVGDDLAQRVAVVLRAHGTLGSAQRGQPLGEPPRGGEQEVAAAAGGVQHRDGEDGVSGE